MGKNRNETGADTGTVNEEGTTEAPWQAPVVDLDEQQAPTGSTRQAPIGDDSISNPNIINR